MRVYICCLALCANTSACSFDIDSSSDPSSSAESTVPTGKTYYVAPTGNDSLSNAGTSPNAPWKTIARANQAVQAGDTVILSGTFTQQPIAPTRSGTSSAPITYRAASTGATIDQAGPVPGGVTYVSYIGARAFIVFDGITFTNSNYVNNPVANKGVMLLGANHVTITRCSFTHVQLQLSRSNDNAVTHNRFRDFISSYIDPSTKKPDPNHPNTSGDMVNVFNGSSRNVIQWNDLKYAGHSLIEMGNGSGNSVLNANNIVSDNIMSNPWYKPLILSDDGGGTIVERNLIMDANTQPTLYSTVPGAVGTFDRSSAGVQLSGRNFILRRNTITNNVAIYGVITIGARWYIDSNPLKPPVLIESMNNQIYHNTIYNNHAAAGVSYVQFQSAADASSGRALPRLTGNVFENNILWGNNGTVYSYNGSTAYSTVMYHSATAVPAWPSGGFNGNTIRNNDFDNASTAYTIDTAFGTASTHRVMTLSSFQQLAHADVYSNVALNPSFTNAGAGDFTLSSASAVIDQGIVITGQPFNGAAPDLGRFEH